MTRRKRADPVAAAAPAEADASPQASVARAGVAAVYRALMLAIDRRRNQLGISMEALDDLAGCQDRYLAKCLHVDAPSGRQARWETVQLFVDALFPDGFDLQLIPKSGRGFEAARYKVLIRWGQTVHNRKSLSEIMSDVAKVRAERLSPERRSAIARKAARARWRKRK